MITLPLAKVDVERRLIIARAAAEEPDRSGEVMDWATAKPEFERWSRSFELATSHLGPDAMSKGNIRLQHDPKRVVGKVVELKLDDDARAADVVCKVVDDQAWRLCQEGCITGLSIGGSYGNKWTDAATGLKKYTPKITEISLVDNPCIPSARIVELVKADGAVEELHLTGRPRSFDEVLSETPPDFEAALAKVAAETPADFEMALAKRTKGAPLSEKEREQRRNAARRKSVVSGAVAGTVYGALGGLFGAKAAARALEEKIERRLAVPRRASEKATDGITIAQRKIEQYDDGIRSTPHGKTVENLKIAALRAARAEADAKATKIRRVLRPVQFVGRHGTKIGAAVGAAAGAGLGYAAHRRKAQK
jgi:hypothetical protein